MQNIIYSYLSPQTYFRRAFILILILSMLISFLVNYFFSSSLEYYLYYTIFFIFLLILVMSLLDHFRKSDYISPHEYFEVRNFINDFLSDLENESFKYSKYFNKFDTSTKKVFEKIFFHNHYLTISSVRKVHSYYEIFLIDMRNIFKINNLVKRKGIIHKITLKKSNDNYKIIHIK